MSNDNKVNFFSLIRYITKVFFPVLFLFYSTSIYATNIRGRIDFQARNGIFPMRGANVELCRVNGGCLSYRTSYDGMYYFRAVSGPHSILVNGRVVTTINVPNQQHFDINPLRGN